MRVLIWGSISAVLFLSVWTIAHISGVVMPSGFAQMQPMGLMSAGFFWGCVVYMLREWVGKRHA